MTTLTAAIELHATRESAALLLRSMAAVNAAASYASRVGFAERPTRRESLHARVYKELRQRSWLSAQQAVHAIAKAVAAFERDASRPHRFRSTGAVPLDVRSVSYRDDAISVLTLQGRLALPYTLGRFQHDALLRAKSIGDASLKVLRDNRFFLEVSYEPFDEAPFDTMACLGVERGLVNIATTSDGQNFCARGLEARRARRRHVRGSMQRKAAKR